MQKNCLVLIVLLSSTLFVGGQEKYFTKTAKITLFSHAPLETIQAVNKTGALVLDSKTMAVQSAVLMRGFEFEKALMQEHFNENYVESDKYPKAEFKGNLQNGGQTDFTHDGTYRATAKGQLTLHGITRPLEAPVTITVQNGKIHAVSTFTISLADFRISIPAIVREKVSKTVRVTIDAALEPLH